MRMLEEAIRDHLELKRRHGADPQEVAVLERQAFGVEWSQSEGGGDAGDGDASDRWDGHDMDLTDGAAGASSDDRDWTEELVFE